MSGTTSALTRSRGQAVELRREIHAAVVHVARDALAVHHLQPQHVVAERADREPRLMPQPISWPSRNSSSGVARRFKPDPAQDPAGLEMPPVAADAPLGGEIGQLLVVLDLGVLEALDQADVAASMSLPGRSMAMAK